MINRLDVVKELLEQVVDVLADAETEDELCIYVEVGLLLQDIEILKHSPNFRLDTPISLN